MAAPAAAPVPRAGARGRALQGLFPAANLPRLSQAAALRCGAGSLPLYGCALQLALPCAVCRGALKPLCAAALQLLFAALLAAATCAALFAAAVCAAILAAAVCAALFAAAVCTAILAACCLGRQSAAALNGGASSPAAAAFHAPRRPGWMPSVCPFCLFRTGKWTFLFI